MNPVIMHLYGPFSIHWYGLCIAIGVSLGLWGAYHTIVQQKKLLSADQLFSMITLLIISGFVGGKLLYFAETGLGSWYELPGQLNNGFSVLGSVIGIWLALAYLARSYRLRILTITDQFACWAAYVQSWGRLGCLCAGCCHGIAATCRLSVCYTHPNSLALQTSVQLIPTQLYSALALFALFLVLQLIQRSKPDLRMGVLTGLYLCGIAVERFVLDFFRADATVINTLGGWQITFQQYISMGILLAAIIVDLYSRAKKT